MMKAIILNGTSSSGKTSLAKALQAKLLAETEEYWLHFQMDAFWAMVPEGVEAHSKNFPQLKQGMLQSAKALLETGHNLIIDIVCANYDKHTFPDLLKTLEPAQIYTIAVTADLAVIEDREKRRGDRTPGLARSQYNQIHDNYTYGFTAYTDKHSPETLAGFFLAENFGKE